MSNKLYSTHKLIKKSEKICPKGGLSRRRPIVVEK